MVGLQQSISYRTQLILCSFAALMLCASLAPWLSYFALEKVDNLEIGFFKKCKADDCNLGIGKNESFANTVLASHPWARYVFAALEIIVVLIGVFYSSVFRWRNTLLTLGLWTLALLSAMILACVGIEYGSLTFAGCNIAGFVSCCVIQYLRLFSYAPTRGFGHHLKLFLNSKYAIELEEDAEKADYKHAGQSLPKFLVLGG